MVIQRITYLVFFFTILSFISNIFPFEEHDFVLKSQVALNELKSNSNDIMCS